MEALLPLEIRIILIVLPKNLNIFTLESLSRLNPTSAPYGLHAEWTESQCGMFLIVPVEMEVFLMKFMENYYLTRIFKF